METLIAFCTVMTIRLSGYHDAYFDHATIIPTGIAYLVVDYDGNTVGHALCSRNDDHVRLSVYDPQRLEQSRHMQRIAEPTHHEEPYYDTSY